MSYITASATAIIPASAETVYAILEDYETAHPAILPKPYFSKLELEHGGKGLDTVFRLEMNVFGAKKIYRMKVVEAIPHTKIVEYDLLEETRTTFDIEEQGTRQCQLRISISSPLYAGLRGWLEGQFSPMISRMIFNKQLKLLAKYASKI